MKFYKVIRHPVDPKEQEAWDKFSRTGQNRPSGKGPAPVIVMTTNPKGAVGSWSPPSRTKSL